MERVVTQPHGSGASGSSPASAAGRGRAVAVGPPRDGPSELVARHRRPRLAAAFVVAVEVAAVVVAVGRPLPGVEGTGRVVERQLLPVDDVADVLGQRPVGPAGVGWRGAGQVPGGIVEAGPGDASADPTAPLRRPTGRVRSREVDRPDVGEGRRAGDRRPVRSLGLARAAAPPTVIDPRSVAPSPERRVASSWSPSSTVRR